MKIYARQITINNAQLLPAKKTTKDFWHQKISLDLKDNADFYCTIYY